MHWIKMNAIKETGKNKSSYNHCDGLLLKQVLKLIFDTVWKWMAKTGLKKSKAPCHALKNDQL